MVTQFSRFSFVIVALAGLLVFASAAVAADDQPASVTHTFRYVPPTGSADVATSVAGDFNSWSATANPMTRGSDGSYSVTVTLSPGVHYYKIVYDGHWMNDPTADKSLDKDDGYGGKNSAFVAGAAEPAPAKAADEGATPQADGQIAHTFRFVPESDVKTVTVSLVGDFNKWSATANPMPRGSDGSYSVTMTLSPGVHFYKIVYDGKWINDPTADKSLEKEDGFGGKNSGIEIRAGADQSPSTKPADGASTAGPR